MTISIKFWFCFHYIFRAWYVVVNRIRKTMVAQEHCYLESFCNAMRYFQKLAAWFRTRPHNLDLCFFWLVCQTAHLIFIPLMLSFSRPANRRPPHPPPAHHRPQHRVQVAVEGGAPGGPHHGGGGQQQQGGGGDSATPLPAGHLLSAPWCARARVSKPSHLWDCTK